MELMNIAPMDIEQESFAIITRELGDRVLDPEQAPIIKRVIHTTADFEYAQQLSFSPDAVRRGRQALGEGATIITDTQMARAGINKRCAGKFGCEVRCFMSDEDVAAMAQARGVTRASVSMDKAAQMGGKLIFAIGNAPTALIRLRELMDEGTVRPSLIIGVPVGFVNVVASKERILDCGAPYIVARGRKGGSNVAAAICNALLYGLDATRGRESGVCI